jgi:hypothetical protein
MGIFKSPSPPTPPPPPPIPPAAQAPTVASGVVGATNAAAMARARGLEGAGFNGTDLTKPGLAGATPTAQMMLGGAK